MSTGKAEIFDNEDLENSQENLNKVAKNFGKQTKRFLKDKEGELKDIAIAYSDHVKEHPIRSVLLGFTAGVLLSKLFGKFSK